QPASPRATTTTGERVARATGAVLATEPATGFETIEFTEPARFAEPAPEAPTLFRAPESTAAPSSILSPAPLPSVPPTPHPAASPNVDELYEHVLERLRRDLLSERERMGDLL